MSKLDELFTDIAFEIVDMVIYSHTHNKINTLKWQRRIDKLVENHVKSERQEIIELVKGMKKTIDEQAWEVLHRVELPDSPDEGNVYNKALDDLLERLEK